MTNDVLKDGRTLDEVNSDIKKNRMVYANVIVASTKNVTFSENGLKTAPTQDGLKVRLSKSV